MAIIFLNHNMKSTSRGLLVTAVIVSIFMALLNSIIFITGLINRPAGSVFLGTIHYYEDYFFYLNHFFQGAHGAILTANRFTPENTPMTLIYWSNILMGKIGGIFRLDPITSYNLGLFLLITASGIAVYLFMSIIFSKSGLLAFYGFIYTMFATSLINRVKAQEGGMIWWPFQIWKTPHFSFDRLGGAPHQTVITLLSYIFFCFYFYKSNTDKKTVLSAVGSVLAIMLLTSINPLQGLFFTGAVWFSFGVLIFLKRLKPSKISFLKPLSVSFSTGIVFILVYQTLNLPPHYQTKIWEASQQSYTTLPFLIKSIGPVLILAFIGLASRFKKLKEAEIFGTVLITFCYFLFLSPIPKKIGFGNVRILFPAFYVFFGMMASYGTYFLARKFSDKFGISVHKSASLIVGLFLLISLPTTVWEISQKLNNDKIDNPMVYLPVNIYNGFSFLSEIKTYDEIATANPLSRMDLLIPALSGHTVYSGHFLTTLDNSTKTALAIAFFSLKMDSESGLDWLKQNRIRYVIHTAYDGNREVFKANYPFLIEIYHNSDVAVYKTE